MRGLGLFALVVAIAVWIGYDFAFPGNARVHTIGVDLVCLGALVLGALGAWSGLYGRGLHDAASHSSVSPLALVAGLPRRDNPGSVPLASRVRGGDIGRADPDVHVHPENRRRGRTRSGEFRSALVTAKAVIVRPSGGVWVGSRTRASIPTSVPLPPPAAETPQKAAVMAVTSSEIVGGLADALVAEVVANQATITSGIGTVEAEAVAGVANLLKQIPVATGVEGFIVAPIEAALETAANKFAQTLVTKYGPSVVYNVLLAFLEAKAKALGG